MMKRPPSFLRRTGAAAMVPIAVVALAGCSEKSSSKQASDQLRKGLVAHHAGRVDEAAKAYREVLEKDPRNKFGYYNLGLIAQDRGDNATAENNYRLALGIDPNFGAALFNLAIVRTVAGDPEGAESLYRKAIAVDPKSAGAHLNLGFLLRSTGRQAEGDAEIAEAGRLDPAFVRRGESQTSSAQPSTTTSAPKAKR